MPSREEDQARRRQRKESDSPRAKDKDKDRDKERDKDRVKSDKRHSRRQSTPERPKSKDQSESLDGSKLSRSSMTNLSARHKTKSVTSVPEMGRRASVGEPKLSSYPAFSKEHSREAVRPATEATKSKVSILTPDPTEGTRSERSKGTRTPGPEAKTRAPPSPPLTSDEAEIRRANSANSSRKPSESIRQDAGRRSVDRGSSRRTAHLRAEDLSSPRKVSRGDDSDSSARTTDSSRGTARRHTPSNAAHRETAERNRTASWKSATPAPPTANTAPASLSREGSQVTDNSDSQATSIAPVPERKPIPTAPRTPAPVKSPTRPTQSPASGPAHQPQPMPGPPLGSIPIRPFSQPAPNPTYQPHPLQAPFNPIPVAAPPPPPPPMDFIDETPRVDYLLHNGGLPYVIPRSLISVPNPAPAQAYNSPRVSQSNAGDSSLRIFHPVTSRLDDLNKVLSKNGSVAVATGYRSVARRLLDRLENVFARNISSEKCHCVVCKSSPEPILSSEEQDGISWGEILEFVSGRRELPQWPPFTIDAETPGLGISGKVDAPMQKLDPDVPDEFRQHYMRQNDKTKRSVQDWLAAQTLNATQTEVPNDVDDDTLSFTMLTRLDPEKRPFFTALMRGHSTIPNGRSPSPSVVNGETENTVLDKTSLALQRLYRLSSRPRKPECTIYLLNNPQLHGMLATLAAISPSEWEILTSGRFDGFLWSGAETGFTSPPSTNPSRVPSRTTTPYSPFNPSSRGPTPFSPLRNVASPQPAGMSRNPTPFSSAGSTTTNTTNGGPVQHDEETEIAVLSELERAIYRDMELLENAFEQVHQQAETLRGKLRSRAAGLMLAAQQRRGSSASEIEVRVGTPGSAWGAGGEEDGQSVFDDGRSELAPDDSASNISFARKRRGKERRTPGVEEEGGTAADRRRRR